MAVPVLLITGPVGVGKTSVAGVVSDLLGEGGVPHAYIDMDGLRSSYPSPPGDRFRVGLGLRNLAAVWPNFRHEGAQRLILADVLEARSELDGYRAAVPGANIEVVRLRAGVESLADRVRGREPESRLDWHLDRAAELAIQMDNDRLEDILIETDGKSIRTIALEVLSQSSWLVEQAES